jgi:uncharacterized damage-inducible protein DinB
MPLDSPGPGRARIAMLEAIERLFRHTAWADRLLLARLRGLPEPPAEAIREYAHVLGADEVWLSRLEGRAAVVPVWPALGLEELAALVETVHQGYERYLAGLGEAGLALMVPYTNSQGQRFETGVLDILLHVALHAHYHRGKLNLLLRQAGSGPAPADYIGFVRGVPAAVTAPAPPSTTTPSGAPAPGARSP